MGPDFNQLDWQTITQLLAQKTTCQEAKEKIDNLKFLSSQQEIKNSFNIISESQVLLTAGVRPHMTSLDLFGLWFNRIKKQAVLKILELKDLRLFCYETIALKECFKDFEGAWAKSIEGNLFEGQKLLDDINRILTPDGQIKRNASKQLNNLFEEKANLERNLEKTLDQTVKKNELTPFLQDRFVTNREGRWVIPVKNGLQREVKGIIHASSRSKQTVFVEPQEVVSINNRLQEVINGIEEEIERILSQLSAEIWNLESEIKNTKDLLLEVDIYLSKAQMANQLKLNPCQFSKENIELYELKNPILLIQGDKVISNTVELNSQNRILILSGPNAGGKTVLLKALGFCFIMAHCGLPICASENSKLPYLKGLKIIVGDEQSLENNLSTFAAHLKSLNDSLNYTGLNNLILVDEICSSTEPEEGAALARGFINSLNKNNVFAIITSHLSPLKKGWGPNDAVLNGSLEYDKATNQPTYEFLVGVAGDSLAIETAKRVGIKQEVIDSAIEFLGPKYREYFSQLAEVKNIKENLLQRSKDYNKKIHNLAKKEKEYDKKILEIEAHKDKVIEREVNIAKQKIDQAINKTKANSIFNSYTDLVKIKKDLPKVIKGKSTSLINTKEEFSKAFSPGSKVYIESLGRDGVIQSTPNSKGDVEVLSNSMKVNVSWESLVPAKNFSNPTHKLIKKSSLYNAISPRDNNRSLDLRGYMVEEALEVLEKNIDKANLNNEDRIKVIHGHGTNNLKKAIRSYLSRSSFVKAWIAGDPISDDDGITWIEV